MPDLLKAVVAFASYENLSDGTRAKLRLETDMGVRYRTAATHDRL